MTKNYGKRITGVMGLHCYLVIYFLTALLASSLFIVYVSQQNAVAQSSSPPPLGYAQYQNSTYGFRINYPSNWLVQPMNSSLVEKYGRIIAFFAPVNSGPEVRVLVNKVPYNSLEQFISVFGNIIQSHSGAQFVTNTTVTKAGQPIRLAGQQAHLLIWTIPPAIAAKITTMDSSSGNIYSIEYLADNDKQYKTYEPDLLKMIDSFQLTGSLQGGGPATVQANQTAASAPTQPSSTSIPGIAGFSDTSGESSLVKDNSSKNPETAGSLPPPSSTKVR